MGKVLLHICCGVCSLQAVLTLQERGYAVSGFFYNPNLYPEGEYQKRLQGARAAAALGAIALEEAAYDPLIWQETCGGLGALPEGGERCRLCYELRLKRTYAEFLNGGYDFFTTTLTISPHKDAKTIFVLGQAIGAEKFLAIDFKKADGFKKTMQLAREHDLYRQNYCGCEYSLAARGRDGRTL